MPARLTSPLAIMIVLALGTPALAGCASTPERIDPTMTSSTEDMQEPEIAAAVEQSSPNISSARAEHVRSGLGVNLYVTFHTSAGALTPTELDAVLRAVEPRLPEGMGVVRVTARDAGGSRLSLAEPARQLGLPELSIKSSGFITMSPAELTERYAG